VTSLLCNKCQLAQRGIAFEALDNGVLSCADPKRLQQICDGLTGDKINALLRKWLRLLPHPFTGADRYAGYRYDISILQAEFSLTQVLDRPAHGRLFFENVIRENLALALNGRFGMIGRSSSNTTTMGLVKRNVTFIDPTSGNLGLEDIKQAIQTVKLGLNFHLLGTAPWWGGSGGLTAAY
jgi:hypothetical protein